MTGRLTIQERDRLGLVDEDLALGEELHQMIAQACVIETEGWAPALCRDAAARLQRAWPVTRYFFPVVVWLSQPTAFTPVGRYVYVTRALLERGLPEASVAFVLAHELAHRALGHLRPLHRHALLRRLPVRTLLSVLSVGAGRFWWSREQELDADRWALHRCLDAGFEAEECFAFFDVLASVYEDYGHLDVAYGNGDPDAYADATFDYAPDEGVAALDELPSMEELHGWLGARVSDWLPSMGRYPTLPERVETLRAEAARQASSRTATLGTVHVSRSSRADPAGDVERARRLLQCGTTPTLADVRERYRGLAREAFVRATADDTENGRRRARARLDALTDALELLECQLLPLPDS